MDWRGVRVLVTGGHGFIGGEVVRQLAAQGAHVVPAGRAEADLRDRDATERLLFEVRPAVVVHCAVEGGGIGWMSRHPVESGRDNALINLHTMDAAAHAGVGLFIGASSACAYPRQPRTIPFVEDELWDGPPEPTNGPYAESKRLMMSLGPAYAEQHGMRCAFGLLANVYGEGDALDEQRAHVVSGLILRCLSMPDELLVWGSGHATREHLHVTDAAAGLLALADWEGPLNIGTGMETSVAELARLVADASGYQGPIRFDASRPDGQPRKVLDVSRATDALGWQARTALRDGLELTVAGYRRVLAT